MDPGLPALWPDSSACAKMRKSSVSVGLLLNAEKLLLLLLLAMLSCFSLCCYLIFLMVWFLFCLLV